MKGNTLPPWRTLLRNTDAQLTILTAHNQLDTFWSLMVANLSTITSFHGVGVVTTPTQSLSSGATRRSKHTHPQIRGVSRWPVTLPPKVEMYIPGEPQHTHPPHAQRASTLTNTKQCTLFRNNCSSVITRF